MDHGIEAKQNKLIQYMGSYDVAQICLNGHVITNMANGHPEHKKDFCIKCGEKTIVSCQNCNTSIKGYYSFENVIGLFDYDKPKYCEKCGQPFPWTARQIDAAKDLIDLTDNLNSEEKADLKSSIDNLVKDGPKTIVAQAKYKKYIVNAGGEIAKAIKDILVNIVSESVKKAVWGNSI